MLLRLFSPRMAVGTVLVLEIQPYARVSTAIASVVGWVWRLAFGEPITDKRERTDKWISHPRLYKIGYRCSV